MIFLLQNWLFPYLYIVMYIGATPQYNMHIIYTYTLIEHKLLISKEDKVSSILPKSLKAYLKVKTYDFLKMKGPYRAVISKVYMHV